MVSFHSEMSAYLQGLRTELSLLQLWTEEDGKLERRIELQRRREMQLAKQMNAARAAERAAERERQLLAAQQEQLASARPDPIGEDGLPALSPPDPGISLSQNTADADSQLRAGSHDCKRR